MSTNIYIAPFHSRLKGSWPYDVGDDPSFQSRQLHRGALTWGVCRPPVRNTMRPGDIVVFFSFPAKQKNQEDEWPKEYRLCAFATVETKISQAEIWTDPKFKIFRRYKNLLVRPGKNGVWEHYEPAFDDVHEHKDWVWRMAHGKRGTKEVYESLNELDAVPSSGKVSGRSFEFGRNYVVFSRNSDETLILADPPVVAYCRENGRTETWKPDPLSQAILKHTLGVGLKHNRRRRFLRSVHKQHAHPPIRWQMSTEEAVKWRQKFTQMLLGLS